MKLIKCSPVILIALLGVHSVVLAMRNATSTVLCEEVVVCKGYGQATIYSRMAGHLQQRGFTFVKQDSASLIIASGDLTIYNYVVGRTIKNPAGNITFDLQVDVRDGKFRCVIRDVLFARSERNRYGRFVFSDDVEPVNEENFRHRTMLLGKIEKQAQEYLSMIAQRIRKEIVNNELETTDW